MTNIFYPYRPNLEGPFIERFHRLAQQLCDTEDAIRVVEATARAEYDWATQTARVNPQQRRLYRASWLLLRDLVRAGWSTRWFNSQLEIAPPNIPDKVHDEHQLAAVKESLRGAMKESRRQKIFDSRDFIERMESPSPMARARVPITALIADGPSLAADLRRVLSFPTQREQMEILRHAIRPYLQLVREHDVCQHTGHRIADIWRYFRFTWATPAENTPGRTMLYLIRDAARPYHPVMGIASLENAPIKITQRDYHLGWSLEAVTEELACATATEQIQAIFQRLVNYVEAAINDINREGLCTLEECLRPTQEVIDRLLSIAAHSEAERQSALKAWEDRDSYTDQSLARSELGNISLEVEDALYRHKRAEQLGRLLSSKRELQGLLSNIALPEASSAFLKSEQGKVAIRTALMAQKSRHIGTSLLEVNVCGAIPPYNELLGGKLVALAVLSPQVVKDYRQRYGSRASDIASRLKGEEVVRPAELVYLGTTSLYKVGSSQYNRLKIPAGLLCPGSPEVRWRPLGVSKGYGTLHISRLTLQCLEEASTRGGVLQVNHVFGEGPSPKLRIIRQALECVFEPGQRYATDELTKHSMGRLVYGAFVAVNGRDYLTGRISSPTYYFDPSEDPAIATERIVDYWRERWLLRRLSSPGVLGKVSSFGPGCMRVSRELSTQTDPAFEAIASEVVAMPEGGAQDRGQSLRDFIRDLYRGSSAYADQTDMALLSTLHVDTRLDQAIVDALSSGKSVILTGNPGDGKTHLLRVVESRLLALPTRPEVVLDASSLPDSRLQELWEATESEDRPFCAAINQAVLFTLAKQYPDFRSVQEACRQVQEAVYYGQEVTLESRVLVFDLSLRDALSPEIVNSALDKITEAALRARCGYCPAEGCDLIRHVSLFKSSLFRERLHTLFARVGHRGYHATLRELQGFLSYLLFGGRTCTGFLRTGGEYKFAAPFLAFTGETELFKALCNSFDPARVSHPIWDEVLVTGTTQSDDWINEWSCETGAIDPSNSTRFAARKRAFYFCHSGGGALLDMAGQDELEFMRFLAMQERDALRMLIRRINRFFGHEMGGDELRVWQSHRYNQSVRKVLYSVAVRPRRDFELIQPRLRSSMAVAFDLALNHVLLRVKSNASIRLRVDFAVFQLLAKAERGIPVMYVDAEVTRRLWKFMELLWEHTDPGPEPTIVVLDPVAGEQLKVIVDLESKQYLSIEKLSRE